MLIPITEIRAGDLILLPSGAAAMVASVDVYREPGVPDDGDDVVERVVVRCEGGRSFAPESVDVEVHLLSRNREPVARW